MSIELQNIIQMFESSDSETRLLAFTLFCESEEVKNRTSVSFYNYIQHYKQCFDEANEELNGFDENMTNKCMDYFVLQIIRRREFGYHRYYYPISPNTLSYKGIRLY